MVIGVEVMLGICEPIEREKKVPDDSEPAHRPVPHDPWGLVI